MFEKVCKLKGGLVVHRRRLHEVSAKKKMFECGKGCGETFKRKANMWNYEKEGLWTRKEEDAPAATRKLTLLTIGRSVWQQ